MSANDPLDILVGTRIRAFRSHRGMSQDDLAGELGIAVQQLQKYEKEIDRVGASSLSRIAAVLGVSIGEFFVSVKDGYLEFDACRPGSIAISHGLSADQ